jgi:hypothetical protein
MEIHRWELRPARSWTDWAMSERKQLNHKTEEILRAFDRQRSEARDLERRYAEETRHAHARDRQVLIERRRHPR